jgi:hypothetical protein
MTLYQWTGYLILWRVRWYTTLIRWVLVWMIGFVSTLVTQSLLITLKYRPYSDIADLHTLHFTVAHALGFPVSTSRLLATGFIIGIIQASRNHTLPIPLHNSTHKVSTSHLKSSEVDELSSSTTILQFTYTSHPQSRINWELTSCGCLLLRTLVNSTDWNITRVALYSLHADRTENPVPLLVSTDCTKNISCGSYCCVRNIPPQTSHVTPTEWVRWHTDHRLATSYKHS